MFDRIVNTPLSYVSFFSEASRFLQCINQSLRMFITICQTKGLRILDQLTDRMFLSCLERYWIFSETFCNVFNEKILALQKNVYSYSKLRNVFFKKWKRKEIYEAVVKDSADAQNFQKVPLLFELTPLSYEDEPIVKIVSNKTVGKIIFHLRSKTFFAPFLKNHRDKLKNTTFQSTRGVYTIL